MDRRPDAAIVKHHVDVVLVPTCMHHPQFGPGNPGRPKGAKNAFVENFWKDLQRVWQEEGLSCLYRVAKDVPDKFILAAANKNRAKSR